MLKSIDGIKVKNGNNTSVMSDVASTMMTSAIYQQDSDVQTKGKITFHNPLLKRPRNLKL